MKTKLLVLILILLAYFKGNTSLANDDTLKSYVNQNKHNPFDYLISKLRDNDIVLLGEKHNQSHQLQMMKSFIERLSKELPSTILALEIPTDEQNNINYFLETGTGLKEVSFPSHLSNPLYKDLLITARESGIKVLTIDMPPRLFKNAQMSRDEYMADRLVSDIEKENKILAIVGSLHVIKTPIEWVVNGHTNNFLGLLLRKKSPNLKVFSICQVLSKPDSDIDKSLSEFKECIACDVDEPFSLYQGGTLPLLNSKPINVHQAFDGIIYHP